MSCLDFRLFFPDVFLDLQQEQQDEGNQAREDFQSYKGKYTLSGCCSAIVKTPSFGTMSESAI